MHRTGGDLIGIRALIGLRLEISVKRCPYRGPIGDGVQCFFSVFGGDRFEGFYGVATGSWGRDFFRAGLGRKIFLENFPGKFFAGIFLLRGKIFENNFETFLSGRKFFSKHSG